MAVTRNINEVIVIKVIFLDFDGVVNNWDHFEGVDFNNVKYLIEIINATGAKIVASSSKKHTFQIDSSIDIKDTTYYKQYVTVLNYYGIDIFDVTPYVDKSRELEIIKYLGMHPEIEEFLILDDDYVIKSLLEHQVFLDLYNGITFEHVQPSIDILNDKLGFYPPEFNFDETYEERLIRIHEYHRSKKK